ncbi:glycoside hydrolase family 3 N-terminal domain-containing protein [Paenibacillus shenyangensis]|uniref:glycoside hydrolase family 3 N-terminal domain-containing protein n=1 Tax=Paenibacillus sp. A9 TaxID=1284352 RepID=UPI00035CBAF3|nr:glycoside hydrolase family 3 N-terminal domain-containing protein [Paenibacillus sp. A9]
MTIQKSNIHAELSALVAPYRKRDVTPRSDENIRESAEQLLNEMTLAEKIGQMSQCADSEFAFGGEIEADPTELLVREGRVGSILGAFNSRRTFDLQKMAIEQSRLRIPLMFNADVIHGYQTIFPIPLAWACSWDLEEIKRACMIAAKEATASGITYNHAPMVDISRDARWGRVMEGAGEDPYLGSLIARAQVEGFQGDSLFSEETLIACLKHFIGYGASEAGRDYNTVDMSEWTLRNVYLPPFKAGLEAGSASVMNAFNFYNGIPVAGNKFILHDLLREELGFDGMLISDYGAVDEIYIHGAARDRKDAARQSLEATMDIEMVTQLYENYLPQLIEEGKVQEAQIDAAVRRILIYKYKIGIMDDPFRYIRPEKEEEYHFHADHLQASRELARKSIVLLKNQDQTLPLQTEAAAAGIQKIAVIGPFADSKDMLGTWQFSRYKEETVTLLEGLTAKGIDEDHLLYAEGSGVNDPIEGGIEQAVRAAEAADIVLLVLGEHSEMSGEAASRMDISIPAVQQQLAEAVVAVGKPVVLVLTNGRPLVLDWYEQNVDAIVETWFLGSQAGHAIADVLTGDYNPTGKLTMSFPKHLGQSPIYYNRFNTGRPLTAENQEEKYISKYLDGPNDPLYPFGYGLSYTEFSYSNLQLDRQQMKSGEQITVTATVTNTGSMAGEEIAQMYIQDLYGTTVRPVRELKGYRKVQLAPQESAKIEFVITEQDLEYCNARLEWTAEEGDFKVYVGTHSGSTLEQTFELIK